MKFFIWGWGWGWGWEAQLVGWCQKVGFGIYQALIKRKLF